MTRVLMQNWKSKREGKKGKRCKIDKVRENGKK